MTNNPTNDALRAALEQIANMQPTVEIIGSPPDPMFLAAKKVARRALATSTTEAEGGESMHYSGDVIDAVQRLIERGKATVDGDGYLVALPETPTQTIQRLG